MRKIRLTVVVVMMGSVLCGCFGDKSNGGEIASTTKSIVVETKAEGNEENTKPLGKVDVLTVVSGQDFEYYCTEEAIKEDYEQGYIVGFTKEQMLIEECDWIEDDNEPNGFRIDMVGENTMDLADEVEVWGLYTYTGTCHIKIPLEDIDNYESMIGYRGYWRFYKNSEGKVCLITQNYIP